MLFENLIPKPGFRLWMQVFITWRTEYCNFPFVGISLTIISMQQFLQNVRIQLFFDTISGELIKPFSLMALVLLEKQSLKSFCNKMMTSLNLSFPFEWGQSILSSGFSF